MNELYDRRGFMKTGAAATAAWAVGREAFATDGSGVKPIERVRVGLVGIGARGTVLLKVLLDLEGVEVKAVCDIVEDRVAKGQNLVTAAGKPRPTGYSRGRPSEVVGIISKEHIADSVADSIKPFG